MADCLNDCNAPLVFPRKIFNRPSLPRISYRIGTYSDFREALLRKLDLDPVLAGWTYRSVDDPGIALIESACIVGDILTLYQEVYANELYLGTATLRQSVAGLVRLLGYRLSPAVGGKALFAFEVKGDQPVIIPARFPVSADLVGLPDTATFETVQELSAIPALGKFALYQPFNVPPVLTGSSTFAIETVKLEQTGVVLEKNSRVMLVMPGGGVNPYHQVAVIDKIEARFEQTEVSIKGSWLGPSSPSISIYKLGRDFRHFGYNSPAKQVEIDSAGTATQVDTDYTRSTFFFILLGAGYIYDPIATGYQLPLDKSVDDVSVGSVFLVDLDLISAVTSFPAFGAHTVSAVQKATLTWGSLTGASTVLTTSSAIFGHSTDIRSVQIHETTGGPLTFSAPRIPVSAPLSKLYFYGSGQDYQAMDGRAILFQRNKPAPGESDAVEHVPVSITTSEVGDLARLTLRPLTLQAALRHFPMSQFPFTFPKDSPPVWVFGNLANASQGKTEKPITLGNGDARASFLTFPIPKSPLTYLLSDSATPPEVAQLVVTVDSLEWKQVSSLLTYGPKEQVYIVREDQTGQSYVQFGDGETGSRVPSGAGNIAVTYRTGAGAYGPMKPGSSPNAGARVLGLDKISMPDEASGGSQPEEVSNARFAAPGKVQSLGRMVSLADYETETRAIPGVAAVSAAWQMVDNIPIIVITVLMDTGRAAELSAVSDLLHNYNVCRGPQRYPILVRPGVRDYVFCDISIALAPSFLEQTVFPQIRAALSAQFSTARSFGEKEYRSRIEGVVQNVEGVLWNNVTALGSLGLADDPALLTLPHPIRSLHETIPCAPNAMLALYPAHLNLSAVAAPTKVC